MLYWKHLYEVPKNFGPSIVAIGNFDGIHLGHQKVLKKVIFLAKKNNCKSVIITFNPHPGIVHNYLDSSQLIMSFNNRIKLLSEKMNIDAILAIKYTYQFSQIEANDFFLKYIVRLFNPRFIVTGSDIKFGKNNVGNLNLVISLSKKNNFKVAIIKKFFLRKRLLCSSTNIRNFLNRGKINIANSMLGRLHLVSSEVIKGFRIGQTIGFPTANLDLKKTQGIIPANGIYACWARTNYFDYQPAAISIGRNVMFESKKRKINKTFEVYIINVNNIMLVDLYKLNLSVKFVQKVRNMISFSNVDNLIKQILLDIKKIKLILKVL